MVKVVHISDTHNLHDHESLKLPDADVLIHSGDSTISSTMPEMRNFADWLKLQAKRYPLVIYTPGNHDYELMNYKFDQYAALFGDKVQLITVGGLVYKGVKFFCCAAPGGWSAIPEDTDVLVTHYPPFGILDEIPAFSKFNRSAHGIHAGSKSLLDEITGRIRPRYHLFGHIHEDGGRQLVGTYTTFSNAAQLDEHYRIQPRPYVFEIEAASVPDGNVPK